jgi:hypothetical protein
MYDLWRRRLWPEDEQDGEDVEAAQDVQEEGAQGEEGEVGEEGWESKVVPDKRSLPSFNRVNATAKKLDETELAALVHGYWCVGCRLSV